MAAQIGKLILRRILSSRMLAPRTGTRTEAVEAPDQAEPAVTSRVLSAQPVMTSLSRDRIGPSFSVFERVKIREDVLGRGIPEQIVHD